MNTRALELEFLPAALEIEETPPLPLARAMLWSIVLFLPIAIAWACIGTVDIVGTYLGSERALRAYLGSELALCHSSIHRRAALSAGL